MIRKNNPARWDVSTIRVPIYATALIIAIFILSGPLAENARAGVQIGSLDCTGVNVNNECRPDSAVSPYAPVYYALMVQTSGTPVNHCAVVGYYGWYFTPEDSNSCTTATTARSYCSRAGADVRFFRGISRSTSNRNFQMRIYLKTADTDCIASPAWVSPPPVDPPPPATYPPLQVGTGFDYNNDGKKDIVEFDPSSPGNGRGGWLRFMNQGMGNFAYAGWIMNGLTNPKQVIRIDYDEDGYEDILEFDPSNPGNGQGGWLRLRNNHNGGFDVNGWAVTGLTEPVASFAFDYNNDGRKDILEFDPSSPGNGKGGWLRFMNTGNGNFAYAGWIMNGLTNPKQVITLDYDEDGYEDILQFDPSNPGNGQGGWLRLRNNHNGGFDVNGWAVTGLTPPVAALAFDYNNDGRKDILEFDPSSPGNGKGGWLRFMNTGNGNFAYAGWIMNGLTNPKQVVSFDYDDDGYKDIIQFDPSNPGGGQGGWLRLHNNHNGGFDVSGWAVTGLTEPKAVL